LLNDRNLDIYNVDTCRFCRCLIRNVTGSLTTLHQVFFAFFEAILVLFFQLEMLGNCLFLKGNCCHSLQLQIDLNLIFNALSTLENSAGSFNVSVLILLCGKVTHMRYAIKIKRISKFMTVQS